MSIFLKTNRLNNLNIINPIINEIKNTPNDTINLTPFLKYINNLSPNRLNSVKKSKSQYSNLYFTPYLLSNNSSSINRAFIDINRLTINHNTNLENLNLFFLCNNNKSNLIKEEKKEIKEIKKIKPINKKEPKDSIRRKILELRKNPKNIGKKENIFIQDDSNKYPINKKIISKSPSNNIEALFRRNKLYKLKKIKEKNNRTLVNKYFTNPESSKIEPKGALDLSEFILLNEIGKGTFGKIFSVKWKKNNKNYALKKEVFNNFEYVEKRKITIKIIKDFLEKTKNKGVIQIYSNLFAKNKEKYCYYELMELGDQDWEKEINSRRQYNLYYSEQELINITSQLIKTLSLLQKNHITHRDIKPQNIMIMKGQYKLCDFGEIRIMKKEGIAFQRIRGSELYMSPILFYGLRGNLKQVKHNTYKSDVFSLGMCLIYASTMYFNCIDEIREIKDMKIVNQVLNKYLGKIYSNKFISLIYLMLQIEEKYRPDFIELEEKFNYLLND